MLIRDKKNILITGSSQGIGLAIAKEIIELHHGTISAYSENETIQFVIQLPMDCHKIVRT